MHLLYLFCSFYSYLKTLVKTFSEITNNTINEMKPLADGKTEVPLKKYMLQLAMNILNKVCELLLLFVSYYK